MERREGRADMLLGLVDGGGHLWADCIPALGAFCLKTNHSSQKLLLPSYCLHESLPMWRAAAEPRNE